MTPMELSLFQTRACGYNHHPAIHSLYKASAISKAQGPEEFISCRLANVLNNSSIVQFVHSFMSEIDTTIACPVLYDAFITWMRHEWGANANPHAHRLLISGSVNKNLNMWLSSLKSFFDSILSKCSSYDISSHSTEEIEKYKHDRETELVKEWKTYKTKYMEHMQNMYNMYSNHTQNLRKTYATHMQNTCKTHATHM